MNDENLSRALRALAVESAYASAPPHLEPALRRAVRGRRGHPNWWRATAAAIVLAVLGLTVARLDQGPAVPTHYRAVTPWYFSAGVPPVESGQLIRMEVPPETAARFGLLVHGPVQADLIIGDDGLTRAIRFVQ
jgi:hypothetical protein